MAPGSAGLVFLARRRSDLSFPPPDVEDPLAGLLSDDEEGTTKKLPGTESKAVSEKSPAPARDQGGAGGLFLVPGRGRGQSLAKLSGAKQRPARRGPQA